MELPKVSITRRQSVPELGGTASFNQLPSEQEVVEHTQPQQIQSLQFLQSSTTFKRSEHDRFGVNSKRKSQSLYEPGEFKGIQTTVKEEEGENGNSHFIGQTKPKAATEEDQDLEFLLLPKQGEEQAPVPEYSSASSSEREAKNTEESNTEFKTTGPESFQSRPKVRKSVHEMRPSAGFQQEMFNPAYEMYNHGLDDSVLNNNGGYHTVSSLPTFSATAYDNFGFNPLNNLQPLTTLGNNIGNSNVGAFHLNPLNQFNMYDPIAQLSNNNFNAFYHPDEVAASNLEKKKRSRIPSSVYRGVSRCGKDNKYQARIRVNGKVKYLGRFKSEIEAAKCYDKHAIEYLGVNAQTNFPYAPTATTQAPN